MRSLFSVLSIGRDKKVHCSSVLVLSSSSQCKSRKRKDWPERLGMGNGHVVISSSDKQSGQKIANF